MIVVLEIIGLLVLFYLLGKSADFIILNIRQIADKLGIKIFYIGLILGFFTTLPELAVGANAIINDLPGISIGNLMGGVIVIFGLILGLSIVLNRQIETESHMGSFILPISLLLLPAILALDGILNFSDGLVIILYYLMVLYYLFEHYTDKGFITLEMVRNGKIIKNILTIFASLVILIVLSNLIIRLTVLMLERLNISSFILGLIVFSIGTNLPEIIVTIRSWQRNLGQLSLSNLIGSAIANILLIGVFSQIIIFRIDIGLEYFLFLATLLILLIAITIFYKTGKKFTRIEGFILIGIYLLFLFSQLLFL